MTLRQKLYILTLIAFLTNLTLYAQTGRIEGQVYDRIEKQGIPFANVWLVDTKIRTATDFDGKFTIDSIPPGTYDLQASEMSYGDTTLTNIKISIDTSITVKLVFPPPCEYDKSKKNRICPICGKTDNVVLIAYGLPMGPLDTTNYYYAGCQITYCDPKWYCKRDKHKFGKRK